MAYAGSNTGPSSRGAKSEPGGSTSKQFSSGAGSLGAKSEPAGNLKSSGISTKGNAKKVGGGR